jgi:D-arabinose 1-dehydrogenase-like Zn-dependent alcohol dehydrogenase
MSVATSTMQAVVMREFGGPEVLELTELPIPQPGPGEVRTRVEAVVVNNTRDVGTRSGSGPFSRFVSPPHVLGGEHAGTIDAVGAGVDPGLVGKRVVANATVPCGSCEFCATGEDQACVSIGLIGIHQQGAYAEFAIAPAANLHLLPDGLSAVDAVVLLTTGGVGLAQVQASGVGAGDVLVVPGVAGALGSMVAELAARKGVRVVGLARDTAHAQAMPLAADAIVDALADDLADQLRSACGPGGAHAIIDNVCVPAIWEACVSVLRPRGRVVISGVIGAGDITINTRRLYLSNQSIIGVRTGNTATLNGFWSEVEDGFRLPAEMITTFALTSVEDVHRQVEAGVKLGHYALETGALADRG